MATTGEPAVGGPSTTGRPETGGSPLRRARTADRTAAVAGLLFIAAVVGSFFSPGTPAGDNPPEAIAAQLRESETGHRLSLLLGFLATLLFLVFVAGLWSRLRRWEGDGGLLASLFALAGIVFATVLLVSSGVYLALVQSATAEFRDPAPLPALASLNDWLGLVAFPAGVAMLLAAAAAIVATRAFPAWLGWVAALAALLLLVGLVGLFGTGADDGIFAIAGFAGLLLLPVWTLATSVLLLLRAGRGPHPAA